MLGVAITAAVAGCPLFGPSFAANQRVDTLPVAASSRAIGIPYNVVTHTTRRAKVRFDYADESDHVRYPIPRHVRIEGGSDRHALLVDRSRCRLYELYALRKAGGGWRAGPGAGLDLRP